MYSIFTWFQELFFGKCKSSAFIGLCQLKEVEEPVYNTNKKEKKSKDIKISDLMRGNN
jgi:hypothetical protein